MGDLLLMMLGFLPEWFMLLIFFAFALFAVIIIFKLLAIIWDGLPFL